MYLSWVFNLQSALKTLTCNDSLVCLSWNHFHCDCLKKHKSHSRQLCTCTPKKRGLVSSVSTVCSISALIVCKHCHVVIAQTKFTQQPLKHDEPTSWPSAGTHSMRTCTHKLNIVWYIYKLTFGFPTKLIMILLSINGPHDSKGG